MSIASYNGRKLVAACFTVFMAGACTMIVELTAGRFISSYVGHSLYTWTAVIGVIMAGIAAGSYTGGKLADRVSATKLLGILFACGCFTCIIIPSLNRLAGNAVVMQALPAGLRICLHVILVFAPFAFVMGAITPVSAAMALSGTTSSGAAVGKVYAAGTAGSIAGTFFAGYFLMAVMGVSLIIHITALIMAGLGLLFGIVEYRAPARDDVKATPPSNETTGRTEIVIYAVAVFVAGLCVMAIEVTAGRMVSRYMGASLYSWTTVIGVMLAGISMGNYSGGRLADRYDTGRLLTLVLSAAALLCLTLPAMNRWLGDGSLLLSFDISWPVRILLHVLIAFLVPSIVLGMIAPVLVKAVLDRGCAQGRTVGGMYALSALGNIAGTFLAGFLLIPHAGSAAAAATSAVLLCIAGLIYKRRSALLWTSTLLCSGTLLSCFCEVPILDYIGMREPASASTVYADESCYSYIRVTKAIDAPNMRKMFLDKLLHSKVNLKDPLNMHYAYSRIYAAVMDKYFPVNGKISTLTLGGGGYVFPRYLELKYPDSLVEVAEIDPGVTKAAHAAFGLPADTQIVTYNCDARQFVSRQIKKGLKGQYDCIIGDAVNDYNIPFHMTTREFVGDIDTLLSERGVYLLTVIDVLNQGRLLGAVVNTCREVFPHVTVFMTVNKPDSRDAFTVICSRTEYELDDIVDWMPRQYKFRGRVFNASEYRALTQRSGELVLTDDFAPVENLLAGVVAQSMRDRDALILRYAERLKDEGRNRDAVAAYRAVLERRPDWVRARETLGLLLVMIGDDEQAELEWLRTIKEDPDAWKACYNLGTLYSKQNNYVKAAEVLRRSLEINPDSDWAHFKLGLAYFVQGQADAAAAEWLATLDVNPSFAEAYGVLGLYYANAGELDKAVTTLRCGLAIDPEQPRVYGDLARILYMVNDLEGARSAVINCRKYGGEPAPELIKALQENR